MMKKLTQRGLPFRNQWKMGVLVVGFLGLLWGNGTFAQMYTPIFSEDFTTENNHSPVGNGWEATTNNPNPLNCTSTGNNAWKVANATLQPKCFQSSNPFLLRPTSEGVKNGRADIVFTIPQGMGGYAQWRIIARHTYDNVNNINYMYQGVISPNHHNTIGLVRNSTASNNYSLHYDAPQSVVLPENRLLKGELITESISTDETRITFNIYDLEDEGKLLATTTMLDATPELQQSGQWGVWTHQIPAFRKFDLYAMDANISVFAVNTIALDTGLFIKFYDDGENTITLSDGNMQGTFSENPVILNDNNNYQATVIYTPAKAGYIVLSGIQSANNAEAIRHKLFVSPYATIIGFIGDSISLDANFHTVEETILNLGTGFSSSNVAMNGSTSSNWASSGDSNIAQMYTSGVEVVSIMLGMNDTRNDQNRSPEYYKITMQALIDKLKVAGFRLVILNEPPAIDRNQSFASGLWDNQSNMRLSGYIEKLNELVAENNGFVVRGDTTVYQYFMDNPNCLVDGIHPNYCGKVYIGEHRASAIKSALEYQITPSNTFTGSNGSGHTLGTTGTLTLRVDKYFGEFSNVVKVDTTPLTSDNYEATSGSTNITLTSDYLNTLSAGTHMLTVEFDGGVQVEEEFIVLSAPLPPIPTPTPTSPSSSGGGGGGGSSLSKDTCPNGDFSSSYYDKTCGTTADLKAEVAEKVNLLRPLIVRIYLTATQEQKTLVYDLISSCSVKNKKEVIKLACQELISNRDF